MAEQVEYSLLEMQDTTYYTKLDIRKIHLRYLIVGSVLSLFLISGLAISIWYPRDVDYPPFPQVYRNATSWQMQQILGLTPGYLLNGSFVDPPSYMRFMDNDYVLPSEKDLLAFLEWSGISKRKYIPGRNDCDDFAFSSYAKKIEYQRKYPGLILAYGILATVKHLDDQGDAVVHMQNMYLDDQMIPWIVEPQNNNIRPFDGSKIITFIIL